MGKVIADISMSIDGYTAGPHQQLGNPMGDGGNQLHEWLFAGKTETDAGLINELVAGTGAVITGANTYFGAIDGAWGGVSPFDVPAVVLSHRRPQKQVTGFTFVSGGITAGLAMARQSAGNKNVWVMGGANVVRQFLEQGLADELHLHIAPILLGAGTRLFGELNTGYPAMKKIVSAETPFATHLYFRIVK